MHVILEIIPSCLPCLIHLELRDRTSRLNSSFETQFDLAWSISTKCKLFQCKSIMYTCIHSIAINNLVNIKKMQNWQEMTSSQHCLYQLKSGWFSGTNIIWHCRKPACPQLISLSFICIRLQVNEAGAGFIVQIYIQNT